ncbi:WG repeat-containing protein [Moraxella sp. ZY210820]|uniref:WG repeat-containing protein n=1 Tax=unclassified Moraxella TaxID=2685852 RepID=UPI00272FB820|nr:WG repeat-containing protein [Moraxella sp. ZY210820]WLF83264.1 WG repeat-containing protein [Moraxella sp. ZY210820]
MKLNVLNLSKLSLSVTIAGLSLFSQNVFACEKPQVEGYQLVSCLSDEGLAKVEKNGKYGVINKTGKIIIPLKYKI